MLKRYLVIILVILITTLTINGGDNRYNENLNMPQDAGGGGNVSPQTGSLSLSINDLTLPGINNLNFSISRIYSVTLANIYNMSTDVNNTSLTTMHTPADWKYGLGSGWTFTLPFMFRDIDDLSQIQKLNLFWEGAAYEIDQTFSSDKNDNNIMYYYVNDMRVYIDTSAVYENEENDPLLGNLNNLNVRSKYCLELKNGTKYYFSEAGNLMLIRNPSDANDVKDAEIWFYYKEHVIVTNDNEYNNYRDCAKIEIAVDSIGRKIDFIYKSGEENWLEEIRYTVNINGVDEERSIKYSHNNLNDYSIYRINSTTKELDIITARIPVNNYKFTLTGLENQMGHFTKYDYMVIESQFSFNPQIGNNNNYYANLTKIYSNYTGEGTGKYKNSLVYEYNNTNGSYKRYLREFADGFMDIFKVTREYALNKYGEVFNDTAYGYYGKSYEKTLNEYWTEVKAGNVKKKYVYGASNVETEDNLLKYVETEANQGGFLERVDYVYDIRKTLKSKSLYRLGVLKYTEEFIYDKWNDLINHKAPNGLVTETTYHNKFHVPIYSQSKDVRNGDGKKFDVEREWLIRESDGKMLAETIYAAINNTVKPIKTKRIKYDGYGNPIEIMDALNNAVKTYYDSTYHIFPEVVEMEVTLEGVKKTVRGFKLFNSDGSIWIEADNDGYAIEHIYDVLGTEIRTIMPDEDDYISITNAADLKSSNWRSSRLANSYVEMEVNYQEEDIITYGEEFDGRRVKTGKFGDGLGHVEKEVLFEDEFGNVEYSVKKMEYDNLGNMIALTDPDASSNYIRRNVMGKMVEVHDRTWLVWYDDLKRKSKVEYPDEQAKVVKKTVSYNDKDLVVTTANTRGYNTVEYYDIDGNLIKTARPNVKDENGMVKDMVYTFEYNQLKQKISFTDPLGEKVTYSFDERGLLTVLNYGNGRDILSYDENGSLLTKRDRNQSLIKFSYDEMSRNIKQEYFNKEDLNNPYYYIELGYNGRGNLVKVDSNKLLEEMVYDARARLKKVDRTILDSTLREDLANKVDWITTSGENDQKFSFEFTYTPNNLVDTMTMPNGKRIKYEYDVDKLRLSGINIDVNANILQEVVTGLEYNRSGQATELNYANGVSQYWNFDLRGRIKNIDVTNSTGNILKLEYKLDTEGNILSINDNQFEYDEVDRIIKSDIIKLGKIDYRVLVRKAFGTSLDQPEAGERIFNKDADLNNDDRINAYDHIKACQDWRDKHDRESFTYDHSGNRRKLVQNGRTYYYYYGETNKLLRIEKDDKIVVEYQYDNNGNTIKRIEHNDDNSTITYTFVYDINNRLIEVKKNNLTHARYIYDNSGMRMYKDEGGKRTYYFRNGGSVNYEIEIDDASSDVIENSYIISGELIAGRVTRKNAGTDEVFYYNLDHLNSTKMVTNQAEEVVLEYEYRAFGTELDRIGTDTNRFSYIGREFDDEINLYYLNARYYDAATGRFINVDPIQDGFNWYVYANNNPLKFVDPTGLKDYLFHTGKFEFNYNVSAEKVLESSNKIDKKLFGGNVNFKFFKDLLSLIPEGGNLITCLQAMNNYKSNKLMQKKVELNEWLIKNKDADISFNITLRIFEITHKKESIGARILYLDASATVVDKNGISSKIDLNMGDINSNYTLLEAYLSESKGNIKSYDREHFEDIIEYVKNDGDTMFKCIDLKNEKNKDINKKEK